QEREKGHKAIGPGLLREHYIENGNGQYCRSHEPRFFIEEELPEGVDHENRERAEYRRRHSDRGLGIPENLNPQMEKRVIKGRVVVVDLCYPSEMLHESELRNGNGNSLVIPHALRANCIEPERKSGGENEENEIILFYKIIYTQIFQSRL